MAEKPGVMVRLVDWQKEHISDRQMTLVLAFVIGVLASVAGYFLHSIVHEIQVLLTSGFEKNTYNLLFLLFPLLLFLNRLPEDGVHIASQRHAPGGGNALDFSTFAITQGGSEAGVIVHKRSLSIRFGYITVVSIYSFWRYCQQF